MDSHSGNFRRWRLWILLVVLLSGGLVLYDAWQVHREHSQDKVILAAAARYGVDAALIKAIVWRESDFDPRVVGRADEIGLMQVTETAGREWADAEHVPFFVASQLFDPARNVRAGTWYLHKLYGRYTDTDDPLPYALADYNAGRANVLRWMKGAAATNSAAFIEQIGFPSTQNYVKTVLQRYEHYRRNFPSPKTRPEGG